MLAFLLIAIKDFLGNNLLRRVFLLLTFSLQSLLISCLNDFHIVIEDQDKYKCLTHRFLGLSFGLEFNLGAAGGLEMDPEVRFSQRIWVRILVLCLLCMFQAFVCYILQLPCGISSF